MFNQLLKDFEQQHPDTSIEDLLAINKQLPEDTPFARAVNQVKNNLSPLNKHRHDDMDVVIYPYRAENARA